MAECPVSWTFSLSSRERGEQWPDHGVEKWYFSRANVSSTIPSPLICRDGDVPKAEAFA
jgi:hypothetical protein